MCGGESVLTAEGSTAQQNAIALFDQAWGRWCPGKNVSYNATGVADAAGIVRSTEEMLRVVPANLREPSYALGAPKWKTIARIVIPTGLSGITTGCLLAAARVLGEAAPLLILVGYSRSTNYDLFDRFMESLPGMMYDQTAAGAGTNPVPTDRLWGAALTLILVIAIINIGARAVAKIVAPKTS